MLVIQLQELFSTLLPFCIEISTSDTETNIEADIISDVQMFTRKRPIARCPKLPAKPPRINPNGPAATPADIEKLLNCVCQIESGACTPGATSVAGDNGLAIGPYQIHEGFWRDGSYEGTNPRGTYPASCEDYNYSREVTRNYWKRYGKGGKPPTNNSIECIARLHNGGPGNGGCPKNPATDAYWKKIKACLSKSYQLLPPPSIP